MYKKEIYGTKFLQSISNRKLLEPINRQAGCSKIWHAECMKKSCVYLGLKMVTNDEGVVT